MQWVKSCDRKPPNSNLVHVKHGADDSKSMATAFYEDGKWTHQNGYSLNFPDDLEWLDESPEDLDILKGALNETRESLSELIRTTTMLQNRHKETFKEHDNKRLEKAQNTLAKYCKDEALKIVQS